MKLTNIKWDVDTKEELKELPKTMILSDDFNINNYNDSDELIDDISDYITDETDYCHDGFDIELTEQEFRDWMFKIDYLNDNQLSELYKKLKNR